MENNTPTLSKLAAFYEQRPRFDPNNYRGAPEVYRQDYGRAYRDLKDCRAFARWFAGSDKFDAILKEKLLTSGRLGLVNGELEYTTGQYWPTEYRAAALSALRRAAWTYYARHCTGKPENEVTGDDVRKAARLSMPRRLAKIICN